MSLEEEGEHEGKEFKQDDVPSFVHTLKLEGTKLLEMPGRPTNPDVVVEVLKHTQVCWCSSFTIFYCRFPL